MMSDTDVIEIYTDGSSRGNPGPGGYGVILKSGPHYKELSAGFRETTNNRMELLAVIVGLEQIKRAPANVVVYSDSKYVVDAVEKGWLRGWVVKGFKGKANPDLWRRFLKIYEQHHVQMKWVKGHNNHPQNERCDELAVQASFQRDLLIDSGYVRKNE